MRAKRRDVGRASATSAAVLDQDKVADRRTRRVDRAGGELQHALRAADQRHEAAPGRQGAVDRQHGPRTVGGGAGDEHGVDREAHEHHVDAVRVGQPQARAGREGAPAHQALELAPQAGRGFEVGGEDRASRQVPGSSPGSGLGGTVRQVQVDHDRDDRRPEDDDEQRGEDAPDEREQHLDRRPGGLGLGPLTALDPELLGLDLEHLRDRHAELLGLDDRADEVGQRPDLGPGHDVAQRLTARLADADLGQRPAELLGERALELLDDLRQRGIEAEACADGDRRAGRACPGSSAGSPSGACGSGHPARTPAARTRGTRPRAISSRLIGKRPRQTRRSRTAGRTRSRRRPRRRP